MDSIVLITNNNTNDDKEKKEEDVKRKIPLKNNKNQLDSNNNSDTE